MLRTVFLVVFIKGLLISASAQNIRIDSLEELLRSNPSDTVRLMAYTAMAEFYSEGKPDSSLYFTRELLRTAERLKLSLYAAYARSEMAYALMNKGDYPGSLKVLLAAKTIAEDPRSEAGTLPGQYNLYQKFYDHPMVASMQRVDLLADIYLKLSILYSNNNDHANEMNCKQRAKELATECENMHMLSTINLLLIRTYLAAKQPDSALAVGQTALRQAMQSGFHKYLGSILLNLGRVYAERGDEKLAAEYMRNAISISSENYPRGVVAGALWFSDLHLKERRPDSALYYARRALHVAMKLDDPGLQLRSDTALLAIYKILSQKDSVLKYQDDIIRINNNLFNTRQAQLFARIDFEEQQRLQDAEAEKNAYRHKMQTIGLLGGLSIFLLVAFLLWRNNRTIQHANKSLTAQKQETELQKNKAEQALTDLKLTQAQLIQSEKMASLGELTAGIAHEIQNPLNFVNNFSELNVELIDELRQDIKKGDAGGAENLAQMIRENSAKIFQHGKRADGIVKNMLQHSASVKGERETADINMLTEENLNLAYQKFIAKNESGEILLVKEFEKMPLYSYIVQQEMGKLLQNIFSNAFYAVSQRSKTNPQGYQPTIIARTRKMKDDIVIEIEDNGIGIHDSIADKIFQPFFTTKPTGEGTGLGLSIAYDIVKSLGGAITVDSVEGDFTRFRVRWPANAPG